MTFFFMFVDLFVSDSAFRKKKHESWCHELLAGQYVTGIDPMKINQSLLEKQFLRFFHSLLA